MRIATFVLGIVFCGIMFLQSCAAYGASTLVDALRPETAASLAPKMAMGMGAAIMALIAMAFSLSKPGTSAILYLVAAVFAWLAHRDGFPDMAIWAAVMFVLANMCVSSWYEIWKKQKPA